MSKTTDELRTDTLKKIKDGTLVRERVTTEETVNDSDFRRSLGISVNTVELNIMGKKKEVPYVGFLLVNGGEVDDPDDVEIVRIAMPWQMLVDLIVEAGTLLEETAAENE